MKRVVLPILFLAAGLTSACKSNAPEVIDPAGEHVLIKADHKHSIYCGHYRYGARWYYLWKHVHGVDCDHELTAGEWVLKT